jgi:hypothetical protein
MAGELFAVGGATYYIGNAAMSPGVEDLDAADFAGVTWVQVKGWLQCGQFGDAAAVITSQRIDRSRDVKGKGTDNAGSMQNVFAFEQGDAGQAAMKAAKASPLNFPFRILWDDVPSGGTTPTTHYFVGPVTSWQNAGGNANAERTVNGTVEINSNVVEVPAA